MRERPLCGARSVRLHRFVCSAIVLTPLNHFRASSLQLSVNSSGVLVLGNLRREPRFRTSKIATYSARCDFVAHSSPQLLVCGERVSVKTTAQLRLLGAVQLPLLVTARRDWVPTCTFCARDHRLNCWNGKLMLLGDSNLPVTTHTTPVVVHDIALQLRLQLFVAALGSTHQFWGT